MSLIAANIPRITVGIVRWILKIVKLLLFLSPLSICHCGRLLTPCTCAQCRKSVWIGVSDGQWRYYFNSWRQLSANWPPLHLSSVSTSSPMSSEKLGAGAGSRHSQLWQVTWGWPVTTQAVSHITGYTNTAPNDPALMVTTQIRSGPCSLSDVTPHVLSGPHPVQGRDQESGHLPLSGRGNVPCPPLARVLTAGRGIKYPPGQRVCVQCLMILAGCLVSGLLTWWLLIHVNCKCSKLPLRRSPVARTPGDTLACHQTTLVLSRTWIITSVLRFLLRMGSTEQEQDSHKVIFIDCYKSISSDSQLCMPESYQNLI